MNPTLSGSEIPANNSRLSTKWTVLNLTLACTFTIHLGCGGTNSGAPITNPAAASQHAIVDGQDVTSMTDARSTTVQVFNQDAGHTVTCTGTLVADDVVLTAAHCVSETAPSRMQLSVGFTEEFHSSFGPYAKTPAARVVAVIKDPRYVEADKVGNSAHDLALIKFIGTLPPGFVVRALPLPSFTATKSDKLQMIGFGVSDEEIRDGGVLRATSLPITKIARSVIDPNTNAQIVLAGNIVVSQPHTGICQGDSGGPLFVKSANGVLTLVGVASKTGNVDDFARACHGFSVFTDVRANLQWLKESIAALRL